MHTETACYDRQYKAGGWSAQVSDGGAERGGGGGGGWSGWNVIKLLLLLTFYLHHVFYIFFKTDRDRETETEKREKKTEKKRKERDRYTKINSKDKLIVKTPLLHTDLLFGFFLILPNYHQ